MNQLNSKNATPSQLPHQTDAHQIISNQVKKFIKRFLLTNIANITPNK